MATDVKGYHTNSQGAKAVRSTRNKKYDAAAKENAEKMAAAKKKYPNKSKGTYGGK